MAQGGAGLLVWARVWKVFGRWNFQKLEAGIEPHDHRQRHVGSSVSFVSP